MERGWGLEENGDSSEIYSGGDAVELVDRVLCNRENGAGAGAGAHGYGGFGVCEASKLVPVSFMSSATSPHPPLGFIEHRVSKFDTLAGVAIKYGVEVNDIKKMNGLVTDLQMFALKSLKIPLPGRHPPAPAVCLSNGSISPGESSCARQKHDDPLELFPSLTEPSRRKVSAAMSSLQGYYGLKPSDRKPKSASYDMGTVDHLGNETSARFSSITNSPLNFHRKSRSYADSLDDETSELFSNPPLSKPGNVDLFNRQMEKLVRRRQKSENDFNCQTPVKILKEETSSSSTLISPITGKSLAQRPKAATRNNNVSSINPDASGESCSADGLDGVIRSSSTSSLQDQDNGTSSSLWLASKMKLKSDLQALSTAAIAIPIFDGLPPIAGRRNKAAID